MQEDGNHTCGMRKILVVKFKWLVLPPLPIYTLKRIKKKEEKKEERERERGIPFRL